MALCSSPDTPSLRYCNGATPPSRMSLTFPFLSLHYSLQRETITYRPQHPLACHHLPPFLPPPYSRPRSHVSSILFSRIFQAHTLITCSSHRPAPTADNPAPADALAHMMLASKSLVAHFETVEHGSLRGLVVLAATLGLTLLSSHVASRLLRSNTFLV